MDPDSIPGVIVVLHRDVGEATRNGRSYNEHLGLRYVLFPTLTLKRLLVRGFLDTRHFCV